jgi:hypothetical protein
LNKIENLRKRGIFDGNPESKGSMFNRNGNSNWNRNGFQSNSGFGNFNNNTSFMSRNNNNGFNRGNNGWN